MRANVSDLDRVLLRQRVMRDVSVRVTATNVLGTSKGARKTFSTP